MITTEMYLTSAAYALIFGLALTLVSGPLFGVLQQEGYAGGALLGWFYRKKGEMIRRYALLALCSALLAALFALIFSFAGMWVGILAAHIGYLGMCAVFLYAMRSALKVPLRKTPRILRLSVVCFCILVAVYFGLSLGMGAASVAIGHPLAHVFLRSVPLALLPLLLPLFVALSNLLAKAYEVPHTKKFIRAAREKLAAAACIKVGITGSFGKTSVKRFAQGILSEKYRVIATPASYNTPAGIAKHVNEGGLDADIFLAEMGARKAGDIAELCDMVCPSVAVITGICPQHLETFGSLEAIRKEKGVLAARAQRTVLGATAEGLCAEALLEGRDFAAENIVCTQEGTSFDLVLGGERLPVRTKLLGRHVAEDLSLAGALAFLLGMTPQEIAAASEKAECVPHRLQHFMGEGGVHILDDSYNSNILGAHDAVEALRLFAGKKYVVTPGLVELGELEEKANEDMGSDLAGLDGVILVGETLVLAVRRGYLAAGGDEAKLRVVPTLQKAQDVLAAELSAGDCVLFLNDLPDKYL